MTTLPGTTAATTRLDPRALALATLLVLIASVTTIHGVPAMLAVFVFACAAHALVAGPGPTRRVLARLAPFAVLVVALNALLVPGDPLVTIAGRRVVSRVGLESGVFAALRLGVMLTTVSVLLAGTSPESMARALHDALRRVSERAAAAAGLFVFLAMSFVPVFADELARIRVAQGFRGGDMSGGPLRRAATVRAWLVPLILSAVHRSGQLALAVELRDVRRRLPLILEPPRARVADVVVVVVTAAAVVAASALR